MFAITTSAPSVLASTHALAARQRALEHHAIDIEEDRATRMSRS